MIQRTPDGDRVRLTIDTWLKLLGILGAILVAAGAWAMKVQVDIALLQQSTANMAVNILELRGQVSRFQENNVRNGHAREAAEEPR